MLPQTMAQLEEIRSDCLKLLHKRAALSAFCAVIPLPGCDLASDVAIMCELLTTINRKFGLDAMQIAQLDRERRKILLVLITSAGNEFIGKVVTTRLIRGVLKQSGKKLAVNQAGRWLPAVGLAFSASVSFGAMYYLGLSHVEQCYQVAKDYMHHVDTRWLGDVIELSSAQQN